MKSRRPGGVAQWFDPDLPGAGELIRETFTCRHCGNVKIVPADKHIDEVSGGCWNCWGLICIPCAEKGVCTPFMKQISEWEESEYRARQRRML